MFFDTCVYHQPGIDLLLDVMPIDNILFASEMVGAVRGIDPETGHYFDDTKRYIDGNKTLSAVDARRSSKAMRAKCSNVFRRTSDAYGPVMRAARLVRALASWVALAAFAALAGAPQDSLAAEPSRIVAVSDVHGAYDSFVGLLRTLGLVDTNLAWAGGDAALVVVGDSVDRGAGSRRVLELLMRLESAAAAAGGRAQLVLGNHEVMNLIGELGYVSAEDFAAYTAEESAAERAAAWQRFRAAHAAGRRRRARSGVREALPAGILRTARGVRGARGARCVAAAPARPAGIGDNAFVHGGLPEAVGAEDAASINARYAGALRDYLSARDTLLAADVLHAEDAFRDHAALAAAFVRAAASEQRAVPDAVSRAAERIAALGLAEPVIGGVYWYRGTVSCSAAVERDRVERALGALGVKRVVVGHTPTPTARVLSRFDGEVLRVDTGMQQPRGRASAIVIRGDDVGVVYAGDPAVVRVEPQPRRVGAVPGGDDALLEDALLHADVTSDTPRVDGARALRLAYRGDMIDAVFEPLPAPRRGERTAPAVAAYRVDRLLDLDLVPVTVLREIGGEVGTVYVDPAALPDERQRVAQRGGAEAWCPLADQFGLMYVFDVLARNPGRAPEDMRYGPGGWQLTLTGNRALFGRETDTPTYLSAAPLRLSPFLRARLQSLTAEQLASALGDVLDAAQRKSLLARRDRLLRAASD